MTTPFLPDLSIDTRFVVQDAPTKPAPIQKPTATTVLSVVVGDNTPSVLCATRYDYELLTPGDPLFGEAPIWETHYSVLNLEVLSSLSMPKLAARVNTIARRLYDRNSKGDYHALVDASDVGRPVVDAIRNSIIPKVHVTAVSVSPNDRGDLSILYRNDSTVGLAYLVSRLKAILQGRRLHLAHGLDSLATMLTQFDASNPPAEMRALALCCCTEYQAVRYGVSFDQLPSARL